ncbi:MAG TPA: phosphodiester glycosidase family protein [Nitrospiraceae bacterium]|nr:phosphodiester glycosidase family protein [Nitrospiraceae bacterium]
MTKTGSVLRRGLTMISRAAVMLLLVLPMAAPAASDESLKWDSVADGLAFATWNPGARCSEDLAAVLVRIDPERYRFAVHHFQDEGLSSPPLMVDWQRRIGASLMFNAGLFLDDFSYMGLLYKDGRSLGKRRHPQWQALFVAEPTEADRRKAGVLDLAFEQFEEERPAYREAAQALMVVDRTGKIRVRQSGKRAQQTLLAEDGGGSIWLLKTTNPATLYGLGDCLRRSFPAMKQVMAMDGGSSSEVLVGADLLTQLTRSGYTPGWRSAVDGTARASHIPLPAVISIRPRAEAAMPSPTRHPAQQPSSSR